MWTTKTVWLRWTHSILANKEHSQHFSPTRRDFIKNTSKSAIALAVAPNFSNDGRKRKPRIVVVGGGLAGMTCAWRLKNAGLDPVVYEAADRLGGRTFTYRNFNENGASCEMGGEFFTSDHHHLVRLTRELKKKVYTASAPNRHLKPFKAFFDNKEIPLEELEKSLSVFFDNILEDLDSLPRSVTWEQADQFRHLDEMSITQYLKSKGADNLAFTFLKKAFTIENGMEANRQSALNLLQTFRDGFIYHPTSKIRSLRLKDGNQSLCTAMASDLWKSIRTNHRLVNLHQYTSWYKLKFKNGKRTKNAHADFVVLAIPFSVLRNIEHNIHFNKRKRLAVNELGYGKKERLLLGFGKKYWREQGYDGLTFSDEMFGYGSDQSPQQKGNRHVLSIKPCGQEADEFARMDTYDATKKCLRSFNKIYPGMSRHFDGQTLKFSWSDNPNFLGSNACYKVGQCSKFAGEEGKAVEDLFFAGEHCSIRYKGTMNGAVETGSNVAASIIRRVQRQRRKRVKV